MCVIYFYDRGEKHTYTLELEMDNLILWIFFQIKIG